MSLKSDRELENTRSKLHCLEERFRELCAEASEDIELRQAEMASLKGLINQFKEEIARYEARQLVRR